MLSAKEDVRVETCGQGVAGGCDAMGGLVTGGYVWGGGGCGNRLICGGGVEGVGAARGESMEQLLICCCYNSVAMAPHHSTARFLRGLAVRVIYVE